MVEKRSTGWAGRRGEDSTKSNVGTTPTARRKPSDAATRSLKPVLSVASVYGTIVVLVWQMWTGKPASPALPSTAVAERPTDPILHQEVQSRMQERQSAAASAVATSAARTKALAYEIMPHMTQIKAADLHYDRVGSAFDSAGEHLHVSWGWTHQSASGLVGDQRQQEASSSLVPRLFEERGSSLGWQSLFEVLLTSGDKVAAKDCSLQRRTVLPSSQEDGYHLLAGEAIELQCPLGLNIQWTGALLRMAGGAEVLRTRFWYESNQEYNVMSLTMWDFDSTLMAACGNKQTQAVERFDCFGASGEVDGSPLIHVGRGLWVALEHPRVTWLSFCKTRMEGRPVESGTTKKGPCAGACCVAAIHTYTGAMTGNMQKQSKPCQKGDIYMRCSR